MLPIGSVGMVDIENRRNEKSDARQRREITKCGQHVCLVNLSEEHASLGIDASTMDVCDEFLEQEAVLTLVTVKAGCPAACRGSPHVSG